MPQFSFSHPFDQYARQYLQLNIFFIWHTEIVPPTHKFATYKFGSPVDCRLTRNTEQERSRTNMKYTH